LADLVIDALQKPSLKLSQVTQMKKRVKMYPPESWEWGMTTSAEVWNGRIAMLGFIALIIELVTGQGLLHMIGLLQ
jgi:ferrochelatase